MTTLSLLRHAWIPLLSLTVFLATSGTSRSEYSATETEHDMTLEQLRCEALLDHSALAIYDARLTETIHGRFCKLQGMTGQIRYVVVMPLPSRWNGRFLMNGDGGHDGDIDIPMDAVMRGFVVANTDLGHSAVANPGSTFAFNNRQAEIDYGYRAVHAAVLAAKNLVIQYYGSPADHSYFDGCSTGGRQAAVEAQRYPDDFDGIIGGALFNNAVEIAMEQVWSSALFMRDVDGDGQGYDNLISPSQIDALRDLVLDRCDVLGNDKISDGMVNNPLACAEVLSEEDIDTFGQEHQLSLGQIQAIKDVYRGPHDASNQNHWYPGKPLGTEYSWKYWIVPTPGQFPEGNGMAPWQAGYAATFMNYLWFEHDPGVPTDYPLDPELLPEKGEYRWLDFDFDQNTPTGKTGNPIVGPWTSHDGGAFMRDILNGSKTNLTEFLVRNNAKYLLYHGWGDGLISGAPTVSYYEGIVEETFNGNLTVAQNNARLFMVPGMGHCGDDFEMGSANQWDRLDVIINWVENGQAPDSIVVSHTNNLDRVDNERIICPWPLQPTYIGPMNGAQNDPVNWIAANFECQPQE